jgi:hypothetical protein
MLILVDTCSCQVWCAAPAAIPLPVHDRRRGPQRRQLRVGRRRTSQRDRHLLRKQQIPSLVSENACFSKPVAMSVGFTAFAGSVPVVRQPDIVLRADQERDDCQDRQEGGRGDRQWRNLPDRAR